MQKLLSFTMLVLLLAGCGRIQMKIEPFVEDCCVTNKDNFINKTIYIGHFKINNKNNIKGVFGKDEVIILSDNETNVRDFIIKDKIDHILRKEFVRRLSENTENVVLVDKKPKDFDINKDIFLFGEINKLWLVNRETKQPNMVNSIATRKTELDFENRYQLLLTTIVNDSIVRSNEKAILTINGDFHNKSLSVTMKILFGDDFKELTTSTNRKLFVNAVLIADIDYYLFERFAGKRTNRQSLTATIYDKNSNIIETIKKNNSGELFNNNTFVYRDYDRGGLIQPFYGRTRRLLYSEMPTDFNVYQNKADLRNIVKSNEFRKKYYCKSDSYSDKNPKYRCPVLVRILNIEYYDLFRLYSSNSGIIQLLINRHIDRVIEKIETIK